MSRRRTLATGRVLAGIVPVLCLSAAAVSAGPPSSPATQLAATQPTDSFGPLEQAMQFWAEDHQQEAASRFLSIDWDKLTFQPGSLFAIKERQIPDMPQTQWQFVFDDGLEASRVLRQLCKHVVQTGDQLLEQKQYPQAEQHYLAVRKCGKAISPPDALAIMQATGISIQNMALEKLIALYEKTGRQDRIPNLRKAQQALKDQNKAMVEQSQRALGKAVEKARTQGLPQP